MVEEGVPFPSRLLGLRFQCLTKGVDREHDLLTPIIWVICTEPSTTGHEPPGTLCNLSCELRAYISYFQSRRLNGPPETVDITRSTNVFAGLCWCPRDLLNAG